MDDAVKLPIDIGYEGVSPDAPPAEQDVQRTIVQPDGTVVIDILTSPPCLIEPHTSEEIVVCAQVESDPQRTRAAPVSPVKSKEPPKAQISLGPNAKVVLRAQTDEPSGSQRVMIDFQLKF